MSSRAQRRANRKNSKLSTGPKTAEGKLASSRNNIRHGLAGRFIVSQLSRDEAIDFDIIAVTLHAEHAPTTATETYLVDRMVEAYYLSSRAIALQSAALLSGDDSRLPLLLRYQTTHERTFSKCLSDLLKLRKERRLEQIGFESQQRRQEAQQAKMQAEEKRKADRQREKEFHEYMNAPMPEYPMPDFPDETSDNPEIQALLDKYKAKKKAELAAKTETEAEEPAA